jgi:hypothetical protein
MCSALAIAANGRSLVRLLMLSLFSAPETWERDSGHAPASGKRPTAELEETAQTA